MADCWTPCGACGCTIFSDAYTRSGSGIDPDGVNIPGQTRYSFSPSSWAIVSNKLQCITSDSPLTFHTGNAYVNFGIVSLNSVGDYVELTNGTLTIRVTVETYVSGGLTKNRLKKEFAGYTEYVNDITLPNSITNLDIMMIDCSQSWNSFICTAVVHTSPDLAKTTQMTHITQGTYFSGLVDYVWKLKASSGVSVDNLLIERNNKNCRTKNPICSDLCGGPYPSSIQITLSNFSDAQTASLTGTGFNACKASCQSTYDSALASLIAETDAYFALHDEDLPDLCDRWQSLNNDLKSCACACIPANYVCRVTSPCSVLNGTFIADKLSATAICGTYGCYVPVPTFYDASGNAYTNYYTYIEISINTFYYDSINQVAQIAFNVNLPSDGGGLLTLCSSITSTRTNVANLCNAAALLTNVTCLGSGFRHKDFRLTVFQKSNNALPIDWYTNRANTQSMTCDATNTLQNCGGDSPDSCSRRLPGGDIADPIEISTSIQTNTGSCTGSDATEVRLSLHG